MPLSLSESSYISTTSLQWSNDSEIKRWVTHSRSEWVSIKVTYWAERDFYFRSLTWSALLINAPRDGEFHKCVYSYNWTRVHTFYIILTLHLEGRGKSISSFLNFKIRSSMMLPSGIFDNKRNLKKCLNRQTTLHSCYLFARNHPHHCNRRVCSEPFSYRTEAYTCHACSPPRLPLLLSSSS